MKKNIITAVALACLLAAPVAQAAAANAGVEMTEMATVKKTSKKKTTKKTTKNTTAKKSTSSKKSSTATTAKVDSSKTAEAATSTSSSSTGLGSVLGGILGAATGSSSSTAGSILSGLTSIFDANKQATASDLAGTWNYTEPAVVFSSENALKNIGGKLASSAIESKLKTQFAKLGIKKGAMKMTFDKDGNFTQTIGTQKFTGTYTTSGKNVVLTYAGGLKQLVGTTQLDGNSLLIVMEAGKLLKYAGTIGKLTGNSTVSTLGSLLGGYDGMEVGMRLQK